MTKDDVIAALKTMFLDELQDIGKAVDAEIRVCVADAFPLIGKTKVGAAMVARCEKRMLAKGSGSKH